METERIEKIKIDEEIELVKVYIDEVLTIEYEMRNGIQYGEEKRYHPNGKIAYLGYAILGIPLGDAYWYDENGREIDYCYYDNGEIIEMLYAEHKELTRKKY